jgi:uncharacterized protein YbgA (DUF1722 family)/uncharacterized protein YbbK (DUF523 family)
MEERIRIGISSCLLGETVRYDGGHRFDPFLADTMGKYVEWVPVCPEVECGLPVPREAMRLTGDPEAPRLVTVETGVDHTETMVSWSREKVLKLEDKELSGFVFKSRSPSSGMKRVQVYSASGRPAGFSSGLFAKTFMEHFPLLPVEEEGRLHDQALRENFIQRVFVLRRWKDYERRDGSSRGLVSFHRDHKLLLLSHSPAHYSSLGRLVAGAGKAKIGDLRAGYAVLLMEGLRRTATVKKNTNVLLHIAGYFKKRLTADEKMELQEVIGDYHDGLLPLIVPVVLLRHHVRKYNEPYLRGQYYLNPHPLELMLRNHA